MNNQNQFPWINKMIPEDDELAQSLTQYDDKLDSYQAGRMGQQGPMPPGAGPMPQTQTAPGRGQMPMPPQPQPGPFPPSGNQPGAGPMMPEAYSQNRMQEMGMPKIAQWGEGMVDKYRAGKWQDKQDDLASALQGGPESNHPTANKPVPIEVDEVQMLNAGGDAQTAYNNNQSPGGTGAASLGNIAGNLFGKWASAYTGGMV